MKDLLNVLYRRILYKIPLKFLLLLLALGAVLFVSFSNAGLVSDGTLGNNISLTSSYVLYSFGDSTHCILNTQVSRTADYKVDEVEYVLSARDFICLTGDVYLKSSQSFNLYEINVSDLIVPCDYSGYVLESDITESYCINKYSNLISESDITSSYCENNGLCSGVVGSGCSNNSGDIQWSALYINNIQHIGGPNIYIDIPEEFNWDYQYSFNDDMYIDIEGYNVDYDKINSIISVQNYKPNDEDLSSIVSSVLPLFVPGLVIILFLYFVFRLIKKIF